jgi:hypothetical protein
MISLQGTLGGPDRKAPRLDATVAAARASARISTTMDSRVIWPFYTFGRLPVPAAIARVANGS